MRHLRPADYTVSDWSGGRTVQLSIGPEGERYADRKFLWRISSATVELETSEFTALPDYERLIAPIRGEMILSHNGGEEILLRPFDVHRFDGADLTISKGKCTDFNLMLRKGKCQGAVIPLRMMDNESADLRGILMQDMPQFDEIMIYCPKGHLDITDDEGNVSRLAPGDTLRIEGDLSKKNWTLKALDGVAAVAAAVRYL